ncbi:hypothetical protein OJF2_51640 [Aquisphaera giovannonii]|uniref:DUF1697 domain-containing protein n=1 Tax=Aquisphaera giovannonii TaxID=406548 RepID=A0A5B9W9R4_9BACT|nr:DUF1697 domain-containing protein [Aquisphaera giovannonii]QEH36580.1 hypothetical protein OJF2_51640 [Aquisphaera giovannonii]
MSKAKTAYILLFRGVGGATQLPTASLREALSEAGFENVATYINSGNAVLRSGLAREKVIASVAKICEARFGFTKAIHAPTLAVWEALIAKNPFPAFKEGKHLHAAVLAGDPTQEAIDRLRGHADVGEAIEVVSRVAYLHTPNGFGRSKLGEKFDKWIGVENTARNWNTVLKLSELATKAAG